MREDIIAAAKRRLRESPITEHAYHGTARLVHRARLVYDRYRFGRYYPAQFFDRLFARHPDPWGYERNPVSKARKELMLKLLPYRIPHLLEIGCAAGWMTATLAERCHAVTAVDISPVAISLAQQRCKHWNHVTFRQLDVLTETFDETFDVIICAGVLVFLPWCAQARIRDRVVKALKPGGTLLLEHTRDAWPGEVGGERIHTLYAEHPELVLLEREQQDIYEALLFRRLLPGSIRANR